MFKFNALHHGESLMAMPYRPFNFYAPALVDYLVSKEAENDADGASAFLERNVWLFREAPELVAPETKDLLIEASQRVARNQCFYDAEVNVYGKFSDTLAELESVLLGGHE